VIAESGSYTTETYSIGIQIDGSIECIQVTGAPVPGEGETDTYTYTVEEDYHYINGDADGNGFINIKDITYLIKYKYKGGPPPDPVEAGDANCDLIVNIKDITYLIKFKYKGGPPPCDVPE
jgi:hypothetical protein